jgi:hemolysin activation/secretion protein
MAAWLVALSPYTIQAAAPVTPGAGSILQQIQPVEPPPAPANNPGLVIEPQGEAQLPPTTPFLVKSIRIKGNALFDTATLHAMVADAEGKNLTLSQLNDLAAGITDYYHRRGYPLARAIIPAQTIQEGEVLLEVIEAHYGRITLDNHSRVKDSLLQAILAPVQSGLPIEQTGLNRSLLLLSDVPGIVSGATLKPGDAVGTSDLVVEASAGPSVTGNLSLDDYGNRYTGRDRAGGTVNFIDPLHQGDYLSVNGLSAGRDMDYGRIAYDALLSGSGTHLGASYSALHYILGDTLASLDGHGTAEVSSLWLRQSFVRTPDVDLYGQLQFDLKQLRDHVDVQSLKTDRHLTNWTLSLSGDTRDAIWSGGVNSWSLGLTSGRVGFDDATAQSFDAQTARTAGRFGKLAANFVRLQALGPGTSLYLNASGQWASTNLDEAEKMAIGGPYTVRAYDMGAISADIGYLLTAELRHDLGHAWHAQWQAVAFVDDSHLTVNKNTWTGGTNEATLRGAGVGLNWAWAKQWSAKAQIAARLGSTPALVGTTSSAHVWIEIAKGF